MRARPLALASALALGAVGTACATEKVAVSFSPWDRTALVGQARAPAPKDRFIAVRGKKKTLPAVPPFPSAFVQTTPEVWAPFDLSIHFGLFDADQAATANGVVACLEIDSILFTIFFDVCGQYDATMMGWDLTAFTDAGNLTGSLFVPGSDAEVRVETNGTTLNFHGRAFGSSTWMPVASTPYPTVNEALRGSFGARFVLKGTLVGFDDPSFVSAAAPGPLSPEREVAADANAALLDGLAAFLALDGANPDFGGAATSLGAAQTALTAAQTGAAALPASRTQKKAAKAFDKGAKKLAGAIEQVADQDADKALKSLGKAAKHVDSGVLLLVPQPFPPSP
jgi:hypothetical protein